MRNSEERNGPAPCDRRFLMASLPAGRSVTIEELTQKLPWVRWSDLFCLIGQLEREGQLTFQQRGFDFEIWSNKSQLVTEKNHHHI